MGQPIEFFPQQASTMARQIDALYLFLVGVAMFFTGLIFLVIVCFYVRYRRGSKASRAGAPTNHLGLEALWVVVPLVLVMVSFGWGAVLFVRAHRPPPEAAEIYVVGKQWMWRVYHPEGRREINQLHVPVGQPIRLKMISEDVIHSFFIPAFRTKQDVLPGRYTGQWFEATRPGAYHLFCAEYCGTSHSLMRGQVVAMTPEAYADWLADPDEEPAEVSGKRLFERLRCDSCHQREATPRGPSLHGVFGRTVTLETGQQVMADLPYLREAILDPNARITAGYEPTMPTYRGQVSEEEILQLITYMRTLEPE